MAPVKCDKCGMVAPKLKRNEFEPAGWHHLLVKDNAGQRYIWECAGCNEAVMTGKNTENAGLPLFDAMT